MNTEQLPLEQTKKADAVNADRDVARVIEVAKRIG